jgi:cytochrome bd-type quinol oxidase subunit 2
MESTTFFDFLDYSILAAIILIAVFALIYFLKKTKSKITQNLSSNSSKSGTISIIIGTVFLILSTIFVVQIEKDIDKTWDFFKPIPIMTAEPIIIFSFALFLAGLILIIVSIHRNMLIKKLSKV